MQKLEMLQEMRDLGYEIIVTPSEHTQEVMFRSPYDNTYKVKHSYSSVWTKLEIQLDVVESLMDWAGYHVVTRVEQRM